MAVAHARIDFFFYGTLRDADVRGVVLGDHARSDPPLSATLVGYRCAPVEGGRYPALVAESGASAEGIVVASVDLLTAARVSYFEGDDYDYEVEFVSATTADGGAHAAWAYLPTRNLAVEPGVWTLEAWRRRHKAQFLRSARRAMERATAARLAPVEAGWRRRMVPA